MNNIVVYHGSSENFDEFSLDFIGSSSGTSGAGFGLYFSSSKLDAARYGNIIYECSIELQKEISNSKVSLTRQSLKTIIDNIDTDIYYNYASTITQAINMLLNSDCDTDIIGDIVNSGCGGNPNIVLKTLSKYGYTHTVDLDSPVHETINHYIVFDPKFIKINKKYVLDKDSVSELIPEKVEMTEHYELKERLENLGFGNVFISEVLGQKHIEFTYVEFKTKEIKEIIFNNIPDDIATNMILNNTLSLIKNVLDTKGNDVITVKSRKNIFTKEITENIKLFINLLIKKM